MPAASRPPQKTKVWERCWDDVKCCSDRCKTERKRAQLAARRQEDAGDDAAGDAPRGRVAPPPSERAEPLREPKAARGAAKRRPAQRQGQAWDDEDR
jgi:hypothetical protein